MTIRIGIVGAGKMGLSHFAIANAIPGASVVAVCDTSRYVLSVLRKHVGVETFTSFEDMFADGGLDAAIVATPTFTHYPCATRALEKGLHLFVEKPLTLSPEESSSLSELAVRQRRVNQVGFHNRFIGTFQEARRLVRGGALGRITSIHGSAFGQVVLKKEEGSTWRSKKSAGGGCLHDYACHVVDLMNFLVGPPQRVAGARMESIFSQDVEDAVYALLVYGEGMVGTLETNWSDDTVRKMSTVVRIEGTHGKLVVDRQELRVHLRAGSAWETYPESWSTRYITGLQAPVAIYLRGEEYSAQMEAFVSAIRTEDAAGENSFASACQTDQVIDQIARASRAGGKGR
jgi:scyllo-inositol 2-dehydrogenase (NADP+)